MFKREDKHAQKTISSTPAVNEVPAQTNKEIVIDLTDKLQEVPINTTNNDEVFEDNHAEKLNKIISVMKELK